MEQTVPRIGFQIRAAIGFLLFLFYAWVAHATPAEPYRLGPQDKVNVKVVEWRSGAGEYFEWEALGGIYKVSASGQLSAPLLGPITVAGLTVDEASLLMAERLRERIQLSRAPFVSMQIEEHRPIFVIGDVDTSGAYPYAPGMTVLQSVALAGGFAEAGAPLVDAAQEVRLSGHLDELRLELRRALLRKERLDAALESRATLVLPFGVPEDQIALKLLEKEQAILTAEREKIETSLKSVVRQKTLAENEISILEDKQALLEERVEVLLADRDRTKNLLDRKLTRTANFIAAETRLGNAKRELLDLSVSLFRARQEFARMEIRGEEIVSDARAKVREDLQATEQNIEQLRAQMQTSSAVLGRTSALGISELLSGEIQFEPIFLIKRRLENGATKDLPADEDNWVQPGDVVKVSRRRVPAAPSTR